MIRRSVVLLFYFALWGRADSLRMRDGSVVAGTFLGGGADDIRFEVNDQVRHFSRADVAEVVFGGSSQGAAASRTPAKIDLGPDYVGAPFLRGMNGYIPLEREVGTTSRSGGGMYGMGGTVYRVQGARSPVRVRQGDRLVFVVRLNGGDDPRRFQLYRLESRMGFRQTQPSMGGMPLARPMTVNKLRDSVYEIMPARGLYPGESAVSPSNTNESYCFGVDY